jgi:beta-galactosidase
LPPIPAPVPVIEIPSIKLNKATDLFALKEKMKPVVSDTPKTFEDLNQGNGYVLYSKHFTKSIKGKLEINGLRDYAIVYVNGKNECVLNRYFKNYSCDIDIPANGTLDILVENMGRINYGAEIIHNLKGIISPVKIDGNEIKGHWEMFKFPMENEPDLKKYADKYVINHPVIYNGSFSLSKTGDTFLDMSKWGKGIVFVNGHNLGRYWNIGPQQTLYLPGCWLKKGVNKIVVFEEINNQQQKELEGIKTPVLDELKK